PQQVGAGAALQVGEAGGRTRVACHNQDRHKTVGEAGAELPANRCGCRACAATVYHDEFKLCDIGGLGHAESMDGDGVALPVEQATHVLKAAGVLRIEEDPRRSGGFHETNSFSRSQPTLYAGVLETLKPTALAGADLPS